MLPSFKAELARTSISGVAPKFWLQSTRPTAPTVGRKLLKAENMRSCASKSVVCLISPSLCNTCCYQSDTPTPLKQHRLKTARKKNAQYKMLRWKTRRWQKKIQITTELTKSCTERPKKTHKTLPTCTCKIDFPSYFRLTKTSPWKAERSVGHSRSTETLTCVCPFGGFKSLCRSCTRLAALKSAVRWKSRKSKWLTRGSTESGLVIPSNSVWSGPKSENIRNYHAQSLSL